METLRRIHRRTCQLLLVWFALSISVALASPVLKPHTGDVICSGSGALMLMPTDDGGQAGSDHDHDCRLCVVVGAPPAFQVFVAHAAPADTPVLQLPSPAPSQSPVPFQQRGPPLL